MLNTNIHTGGHTHIHTHTHTHTHTHIHTHTHTHPPATLAYAWQRATCAMRAQMMEGLLCCCVGDARPPAIAPKNASVSTGNRTNPHALRSKSRKSAVKWRGSPQSRTATSAKEQRKPERRRFQAVRNAVRCATVRASASGMTGERTKTHAHHVRRARLP